MKLINQIINQYTTPEQRAFIKKQEARTKAYLGKKIIRDVINNGKVVAKSTLETMKAMNPTLAATIDEGKKYLNKDVKGLVTDAGITALGLVGLKGIDKARIAAVKANPKAAELIKKGVESFNKPKQGSVEALDALLKEVKKRGLKVTDAVQKDSMDVLEFLEKYGLPNNKLLTTTKGNLDDAFATLLKENGAQTKKLFEELNVKSKAEIPNVIKFVKEFGELLKASPKRIKGENVGAKFSGIDVYDMYQAFKQAGNKLIGLTKDQIKNHPILSLAYSSLGLIGAGGLAYVAGKKLFGKDDNLEKEIKAGIAYPGLEEELGEQYLVGQSGKKYHVVGNRAYDYSTGRPANIEQFLDDVTAKVNFDTQSINDQIKIKQDQLAQLEQAEQNGYQVNPQFRQGIINDIGRLQQDLSNLPTVNVNYRDPVLSFDENDDIEQQYKDNVVAPQQAKQEYQQQIQQQQVDDQYNQIVNDIYNKVANAYQQDLDTYFTPDNLAIEYGKYMNQVFMGQAQPLSPERFAEISKAQYMHQLLPTIANQAQAQVQALMTGQKNVYDYLNKQQTLAETGRHNRATEGIDVYKAQSDVADKRVQRQQKNIELGLSANKQAQDYELGRGGLEVSQQNAATNRMNAVTRQEALPFQQAANIGEFMSGVSMGDVPINELTQSNPQLFQKVFPGPEQQQQPGQPVTNQDKINVIQNYYRGQQ
jgi:hypothetical protein